MFGRAGLCSLVSEPMDAQWTHVVGRRPLIVGVQQQASHFMAVASYAARTVLNSRLVDAVQDGEATSARRSPRVPARRRPRR
jgi:hypothetical protein